MVVVLYGFAIAEVVGIQLTHLIRRRRIILYGPEPPVELAKLIRQDRNYRLTIDPLCFW